MRHSTIGIMLVLALGYLVAPRAAAAQQPAKVYRIGFLGPSATATAVNNMVEAGIVESVARPGGNITGSFMPSRELEVKRLELFKEAFPGVTRVAVLLGPPSPTTPTVRQSLVEALERTARELGMALHLVEVHGPDDLERALRAIAHGQAEALLVADSVLLNIPAHRKRILDFVVEQRLPTMGAYRDYLMAYQVRYRALFRRGAVFIDKILKGARPGDLPMERALHFDLTIDLKMAQELGLTIPESLLLRADKVFPASGVPLPQVLRIVPPDRRVAPEFAAFAGKWFGTWEGDKTQELILIVEAIDPPQAQVIVAWGNGTAGAGAAHPQRLLSDWQRERGQFVEGTLQVSLLGGAGNLPPPAGRHAGRDADPVW